MSLPLSTNARVSTGMHPLRPIFFASFFFSFHVALLSYLNSTVLAMHGTPLQTTVAYSIASALSLILITLAPTMAERMGTSKFLIFGLGLSTFLLWVLGLITTHMGFVWIFALYFSLNTVIWYAFDLVVEHYSRESITGNIRGFYLTLNNVGWVGAPIIASFIVGIAGFTGTYFIASAAALVSLLIIRHTTRIKSTTHTPKISLRKAFRELVGHVQARRLVTLYFVLQFFFAWMVLYMAPYLRTFGFSWSTIGLIFSIMLLPFVLLQYGVGKMLDKHHNERSLIVIGFGIASAATLLLALPLPTEAAVFASILFFTRVGASIIEVACESAFFKAVTERDTALISTLRMTLPLAYIIAPLIGAVILYFGSMQLLFIILSALMLAAMLYALRLTLT